MKSYFKPLLISCTFTFMTEMQADKENYTPIELIVKSEAEWQQELNHEEYQVLRKEGTERAGTSELLNEKRSGIYTCTGCNLPLFSSVTKFESGTGWPSYHAPIDSRHVGMKVDKKLWTTRTEVHCSRCGGHLGHVFKDGPAPTGLRYCINGVALDFVPMGEENIGQSEPDITHKDILD